MIEITKWEENIRSTTPKLDKENFVYQIVRFGFFPNQFPNCFSSKLFSEHIDDLKPLATSAKNQAENPKKNTTQPTTLSIRKDDIVRRVLSIPNPKAFLRAANFMQSNWEHIQTYTESNHSLSPITYIHDYENSALILLNSENVREEYSSRSSYIESIHNSIKASIGFKYRLKVDIANCYDSIYTHSITWAVCGKNEAKTYLHKTKPVSIKEIYVFADRLDKFTRYMKNNETNGIIVGPFTSRIISEIVLAAIDKSLEKESYIFRRYVDDYKFYFKNKSDAQASLPKIERILNEYGLRLNSSKTIIDKYPYELLLNLNSRFKEALNRDGVFGVLNEASTLYLSGEKGAYKYALKLISDKPPKRGQFEITMSSLVNIILIEPKYGRYVIKYFIDYMSGWKDDVISELINHELGVALKNELQDESLVFLQILKEMNLDISGRNINDVLNSDNDFGIIIGLDYWKNHNKMVIRSKTEAAEINKSIYKLCKNLKNEEYNGSRWLLLYESLFHKLLDKYTKPNPKTDDFFEKLLELKVTFYIP